MFQVSILAFHDFGYVASWVTVWSGSNLRHLTKEDFNFLKSKYGLKNLALSNKYCYC